MGDVLGERSRCRAICIERHRNKLCRSGGISDRRRISRKITRMLIMAASVGWIHIGTACEFLPLREMFRRKMKNIRQPTHANVTLHPT